MGPQAARPARTTGNYKTGTSSHNAVFTQGESQVSKHMESGKAHLKKSTV